MAPARTDYALQRAAQGHSSHFRQMLTTQLRELESDGLVNREVFAEIPARTEHRLTEKGKRAVRVVELIRFYGLELVQEYGIDLEKANPVDLAGKE